MVCVQPSARSLATRRSTSQRSRALLFNTDEFEDMAAERQFIPEGCGVKYIPICGLDKEQTRTPDGLHGVESHTPSVMLTNKSHIKSENK